MLGYSLSHGGVPSSLHQENATCMPSGEKLALLSKPGYVVRGTGVRTLSGPPKFTYQTAAAVRATAAAAVTKGQGDCCRRVRRLAALGDTALSASCLTASKAAFKSYMFSK